MKNNRKNRVAVFAVLVLLIGCMAVLAGCNDGNVTDIAISSADAPKKLYVQGQDLDMSVGTLTAMVKGDATAVPLDADGVTVTGYDKNQLGKQTLTVNYKGKSTTFEVTVVARLTVENHETNYFVGASLDLTKGRVKVAGDDGSFTMVNLDSKDLTITGFDSTSAGKVTVNVAYGDYSTSFDVTVYSAGDVVFTKPNRAVYQSHETELVLAGGYFTVTAAENPEFFQYINITEDMVSGFNPAAATRENQTQPLKQTLTVSYAGKSFQYEISVMYGSVALIRDNAKLLEGLDWSDTVTLTEEQGKAAQEAVAEYLKLTSFDKELVDGATLETIVRPAAQYLSEQLAIEAETFSKSFKLDENGSILFVGESYEQLGVDTLRLADLEEKFNVYADLLRQMEAEFGEMEMTKDVTVEEYIVVVSEEEAAFCVNVFGFLMGLHDTLKDIPDDWKVEDLGAYAENINTAVFLIQANGMIGPNFSYIFDVLANWRTNDDYFDIIYSYYCYVAEDGKAFIFDNLWQQLPLPGKLQDWYLAFYKAVIEAQYMEKNGDTDAYLWDTTSFMKYYFDALRISEEIKSGDNQLYKDVYEIIYGDAFMDQNVTSVVGGFVAHSNGLLDSQLYIQLWQTYLEAIALFNEGEYDTELYAETVEAAFETFAQLTPTEVFGFIASLKYKYAESNGTFLALDYSEKASSSFVYLVANHYIGKLPESARPLFQQMLLAMENYGIYRAVGAESKGLENFKSIMEGMSATLAGLSTEDRAAFDDLLGDCYGKYRNLYDAITAPKEFDIDQVTLDRIHQLQEMIGGFYEAIEYINAEGRTEQDQKAACILVYALYEKAKSLYTELMASENADVITLLQTKQYSITDQEETLEESFYKVRNAFVWYMFFGVRFEQKNEAGEVVNLCSTWSIYEKTQLRVFLRDAAELLLAGFKGNAAELDRDYVAKVMADFHQLNSESIVSMYMIGPSRYFDCLEQYLHGQMADDAATKELATAVLEVAFGYMVYETYEHAETEIRYFKTQFEEARELYEKLQDRTLFDTYLKEMYENFQKLYSTL